MSYGSTDLFTASPKAIDPERFIIATYLVETTGAPILDAGVKIAAEESVGTWTEVSTATQWALRTLSAKVVETKLMAGNTGIVRIAFPLDLFDLDKGGIPNLLTIVAGNLFGLSDLANVRLMDLQFPSAVASIFKGPKFGIEGVRTILGTTASRRPHLGTIIKPKVGLTPKETAEVAYEAAIGGVDFIKDDETLTDQRFCPLEERVARMMEALDSVISETGRRILYSPNITCETHRILELADVAIKHGAPALMVAVVATGYSAVRLLAEDPNIKVPIHVHRTMHAAMTRNPHHGISSKVIAQLVRLAGGDQAHAGTTTGKMGGNERTRAEVREIYSFLRGDFHGLKTVFPVASGGIHPGIVPDNIASLGNDIVIQAGGGIHGHPSGTRAGAMAMRQSIDATVHGIPLEKYAKSHVELASALEKWNRRYA